ncbi:MAG TPA: methylated-DNA--[protein]-cysteine S-methyltransferase [Treponemataceae bacterium]|nr:methylated-DNA--[protein]-cysteine S-methyltransferase [Treponemataceae bacterium]
MNHYFSFSGIGSLVLVEQGGILVGLDFLDAPVLTASQETPLKKQCFREISEYLEGKRKVFSIPMSARGTPFQEAVWDVVLSIPFGSTLTYSQIAERIGSPRACRAVGTAVGKNPLPILIPCHRVVSRSGLGGYSGGLPIKIRLLALEDIRY